MWCNACGIIVSSNFPDPETLEPAGGKQTQIPPKRAYRYK